MHGDLVLVLLVLVLGCAAFFIGVIYLACSFVAMVWRGLVGLGRGRKAGSLCRGVVTRGPQVCPRERCGKVEHRPARFCSQCGAALRGATATDDAYLRY